ncbi:hypothetical protein LOAG_01723 [Loa loa]|uniref:Uncharacterized protein n=1 Tax=Loa loa TaxID=7209 RepID=A0A1I7VE73_LOALO|nr:hypothetical protein LOAG_01723 [Loa loa]EFO26760.1 hypothetical protein LOAG_01723 [Loa loa]
MPSSSSHFHRLKTANTELVVLSLLLLQKSREGYTPPPTYTSVLFPTSTSCVSNLGIFADWVNPTVADLAQEFPNPCADAPSASARIICNQLHEWDRKARAKPPVGSFAVSPPAIPGRGRMIAAQLAPITSTPYQCLDLECLCTYLRGK